MNGRIIRNFGLSANAPAAVNFVVAKIFGDGLLADFCGGERVGNGRFCQRKPPRIGAKNKRSTPCQSIQTGLNKLWVIPINRKGATRHALGVAKRWRIANDEIVLPLFLNQKLPAVLGKDAVLLARMESIVL